MTERANLALGIARLAIGRAAGLEQFGRTTQSFLNSLAPLLAFPIVGSMIEMVRGRPLDALTTLLVSLILQLAPPVISHALAVWWGREARWLQYATAYNWCFWVLPPVLAVLMIVFGVAVGAGLPDWLAANGVVAGLGIYSLWLHWFLGRHALDLARWKAAVLVVAVNGLTLLLVLGPAQLG